MSSRHGTGPADAVAAFIPRFQWTLVVLAGLGVIGMVGYMVIEGQSWGDSLYMTAITVSAVGYQEVFPLSAPGRVFTMLLLLGGITWLGLWFANLTSLIVELDLKGALRAAPSAWPPSYSGPPPCRSWTSRPARPIWPSGWSRSWWAAALG